MSDVDIEEIKLATSGRWGSILSALAPQLQDAIAAAPRHVPCPVHGGVDGFRFFKDFEETGGGACNSCGFFSDGISTLEWANGWSFLECINQLSGYLGTDVVETRIQSPLDSGDSWRNDTANRLRMQSVWRGTIEDPGLISAYLKSRGLSGVVPKSLRLYPLMNYFDPSSALIGAFPVMCAPVQLPTGEMVSVHRTYLKPDGSGKADLSPARKLVTSVYPGATRGASIRLGPVSRVICVTEGIETGLAVQEHTGITTLSAISAGNLERFEPPRGVRFVEIWADNDISGTGQRSSARAERSLSSLGYIVSVKMSPVIGADWLDVLCG